MADRRSEPPRYMCAELVKVRIQNGTEAQEAVDNLEDVSPSGVRMMLFLDS